MWKVESQGSLYIFTHYKKKCVQHAVMHKGFEIHAPQNDITTLQCNIDVNRIVLNDYTYMYLVILLNQITLFL